MFHVTAFYLTRHFKILIFDMQICWRLSVNGHGVPIATIL